MRRSLATSTHGDTDVRWTPNQLAFMRAVEASDVSKCRQLLDDNPGLNVDRMDGLGRSPLRLAVSNEHRELVELLVERCNSDNVQQAALQAISENYSSIAELILRHPVYLDVIKARVKMGDVDGFFKTEAESQFSSDMTPLNLAAQKNNFAIVQLLIQRGDVIHKPHKFDCNCTDCRNRMKFDMLRMAYFRLNAYRGLASEAYVSLSSEDPILTAFQLAKELRKLAMEEVHFKKEYKTLAGQLSGYVVKLLDRVWTREELEVVLNREGATPGVKTEDLCMLKMAIENKEKKFVAHPSVQQYLVRLWHHGLPVPDLQTVSPAPRLLLLLGLALLYPLVLTAHLFRPHSKWGRLAKQPMVKFMGHTLSLFGFLLLIVVYSHDDQLSVSSNVTLSSQYPKIHSNYTIFRNRVNPEPYEDFGEDFPLRPSFPTAIQYLFALWVLGMVVLEVQKLWEAGFVVHFADLYNVADFCLLVTYIAALVLFRLTLRMTRAALTDLDGCSADHMQQHYKQSLTQFYWLNTDRTKWRTSDPVNIAEGLFAMANIVSVSRVFALLPANETLGPMQISLRRMINDIIKFLLFAAAAVGGFLVSLRSLFWWYSETLSQELARDPTIKDDKSFMGVRAQFTTIFWWIYGRGPMNQAVTLPKRYENSQVTEGVGRFLVALYHIIIIVVLVNLLIAMMARSFEKIVGDVDAEWKYARSQLFMEYISDTCVLPVPVNILAPLRDVIATLVTRLRHVHKDPEPSEVAGVRRRRAACYNNVCFNDFIEVGSSPGSGKVLGKYAASPRHVPCDKQPTYQEITQAIVQRYIFDVLREEEINKGRLEEARQTLREAKSELLDVMQQRGRSAGHLVQCLQAARSELTTLLPATPQGSPLRRGKKHVQ